MSDLYSKIKKDLADNLEKLGNIASSKSVQIAVHSLQKKLLAETFSLLIVGQFKRGKTTFINALLGRDFLPTAIIPFTSIITILNYGEKLGIEVVFKKGEKKEITEEKLNLYITEKHNPQNEKGIDRVEITYPSLYLKKGVQIIDTPGVASIHKHNTQTTYEYLPKADAAIFLLSVDPPLTQAELSFLADIKKTAAKIFFIQNKIDTVGRADWEESLAFSKRAIEERAGFEDITIYPLSAKEALEGKIENDQQKIALSGLRNFERVLELFLIKEKGKILEHSLNEKMISLINQEFLLAEIEKKAFSFSIEELNNKIKTFQIFINDINQEWVDSSRLFKAEIINLEKEILAGDLEKLKQEKTAWLLTEILRFAAGQQKISNQKFAKLIEKFISVNIKTIFNVWRIKEEKILKKEIAVISGHFIKRLDAITEKIFSSSAELFGLARREIRISETLAPKIEFRFQIKDEDTMLSIIIDSFKKILPKIIAHKLILKEAQDNIVQLIDRHCGKSRYDFSRRLDKLVQEYYLSMEITIKSMQSEVLKVLETGIKSKQETSDNIIHQENQLNQRLSILKILQISTQQIKTLINKQ